MKKLFALALTICLMLTALCITAFAAEPPAEGVVLRVSGLLSDGNLVTYEDHKGMETGWNAAIDLALNTETLKEQGFKRVVVDLYADWTAKNEDFGEDSDGFDEGAIVFPEDVHITLNLNGHTIDRALTEWEYDGSVIYICEDADVIINDGTITGGYSCDSAGGIDIAEYATVILNNVHVKGNWVEDDLGGGIAVLYRASLTMNGGSLCDNVADESYSAALLGAEDNGGGGIFVKDASIVLEGVTIQNNQIAGAGYDAYGAAICAVNSRVTMNNCNVTGNGIEDDAKGFVCPDNIICGLQQSTFTITNTTFTNNGTIEGTPHAVLYLNGKPILNMDNCTFTGNNADNLIEGVPDFSIWNCTFLDNNSNVLALGDMFGGDKLTFNNCTFNNNLNTSRDYYTTFGFYFRDKEDLDLTFTDCDLGNSTFSHEGFYKIVSTAKPEAVPEEVIPEETVPEETTPEKIITEETTPSMEGTILNAGSSMSMVVALLALCVSVASLVATIMLYKKISSANNK